MKNTSTFERSVLQSAINNQINSLKTSHLGSGLRGPHCALGGIDGAFIAKSADVLSMKVTAGDLVYMADAVGQVVGLIQKATELYAIVDELSAVRAHSPHSIHVGRRVSRRSLWVATDMKIALAWYAVGGDIVDILQ